MEEHPRDNHKDAMPSPGDTLQQEEQQEQQETKVIEQPVESPEEAPLAESIADDKEPHDVIVRQDTPQQDVTEPLESQISRSSPSITDTASTTALDMSAVSSFLDADPQLLQSLNIAILQKIEAKITEVSTLQSEKLLLEVNLEQATHLSNKKAQIFKGQLAKAQSLNKELTEANESLLSTKDQLQQQVSDLDIRFQSTTSASGLSQSRIEELASDNKKNLELIDKKAREITSLQSEYNELQDSNRNLRKKLIELETSSQVDASSLTHEKMNVQSLENKLELLEKNHDWLNVELQKTTQEFSQYRKDKSSELVILQSELDKERSKLHNLNIRYDSLSSRADVSAKKLDDALIQVKTLTDEKVTNEEEFMKEMSAKDRLVNLLQVSNDDAKTKISYLENRLQNSRSSVADESAVLQVTVDHYKASLEKSEKKIKQLEDTVNELSQPGSADANASFVSLPALSPSAKATAAKHAGISLSQLYSEVALLKRMLTHERRAKESVEQQMESFVVELEQKAPLINASRTRVCQLENDLAELSVLLENTTREKEQMHKSQSDLQNKVHESQLQINVLNKQRVDLARQVQQLLIQATVRDDNGGHLTPAEQQALARIAKGDKLINESDTDKVISERLVTFQSIVELQQKNEELLRIIRELGSKLEQVELTSKSKMDDLESVAINEAKEAILTLQEELSSLETKYNAVTRERDTFRSMVQNKGSSNNILGGDLTREQNHQTIEVTKKLNDLENEHKFVCEQLKQVKIESVTTINLLNQQITKLSDERSNLSVALAHEKSAGSLADERYRALDDNFKYAKSEIESLRQSTQRLQDSLAKQDLRTQNAAEDLVQAKGLIDTVRMESSNLKAEKQIWKSVEMRLTQENRSLIAEKNQLSDMLTKLRIISTEREDSASKAHERLSVQSQSLEAELTVARTNLEKINNELKDALNSKSTESQAHQARIDALISELSSIKGELSAKNASTEQLKSRIDTLTSSLATAESRVQYYQSLTDSTSESDLIAKTITLKSELEQTRSDLDAANLSIESFKQIAEAAEDALESMNSSFDAYKESSSTQINELESENKRLEEKVFVLNEELQTLYTELSSQQSTAQTQIEVLRKESEELRAQVSNSADLKADYDAKVALIESSYQQQVEVANEAQQNYAKELQKHAEASKAFSALREETNALKHQIAELSSEAKSAKEQLANSAESWETQKIQLEEELRVKDSRVKDLDSQNHILYNEIEKLTQRKSSDNVSEIQDIESSSDEYRELVNLLRHEKEISDSQLDVATRDLKRARQQLDLVTADLDKTRLELVKAQAHDSDLDRLSSEQNKLLEELQQLNLLRESNTTLRNELRSNIDRVKELEKAISASNAKVTPLESKISELHADLNHKDQELKLVSEDRNRWKQKSLDIINKYDRVDPDEYLKAKNEVENLTRRNDEISKALEQSTAAVDELKSKFDRVRKEAVEKLRKKDADLKVLSEQNSDLQKQLTESSESSQKQIGSLMKSMQTLQSKSDELSKSTDSSEDTSAELAAVKTELGNVKTELANALAKTSELETLANDSQASKSSLETRVTELVCQIESLEESLRSKNAQLDKRDTHALDSSSTALESSVSQLRTEITELEARKAALEAVVAETQEAQHPQQVSEAEQRVLDGAVVNDKTAKDKSLQEALKEQEDKLRAEFDEESKVKVSTALEQLKARIRAPSESRLQQLVANKTKQLENEYEKKIDVLKTDYEKKIADVRSSIAKPSADIEKVKVEYEAKIATLKKELETVEAKTLEEGRKLGREATLKETQMRFKLLQNKLDKLITENKKLKSNTEKPTSISESQAATGAAGAAESGQKRPAEGPTQQPQEKKSRIED